MPPLPREGAATRDVDRTQEDRADGELLRAGNVNEADRVQIKQTVDQIVNQSPVD